MENKRNLLVWLIPIALLVVIFGPAVLQGFSSSPPEVESKNTEENSENLEDSKTISNTEQTSTEVSEDTETEEELREPKLELTTIEIVKLKKNDKVNYKKYIAEAIDSKGKESIDKVKWTEIDPTYTDTTQGITYTFKDPYTEKELKSILLVRFEK